MPDTNLVARRCTPSFFHCDIDEIRFVGKLVIIGPTDIFINQRTECYLNNAINLRTLTPHIMTCYTHKMTVVSRP